MQTIASKLSLGGGLVMFSEAPNRDVVIIQLLCRSMSYFLAVIYILIDICLNISNEGGKQLRGLNLKAVQCPIYIQYSLEAIYDVLNLNVHSLSFL